MTDTIVVPQIVVQTVEAGPQIVEIQSNADVHVITAGIQGPAGQGVPSGGTAGQYLKKTSKTDYITDWESFADALTALAEITPANNYFPYFTGSNTAALGSVTSIARTFLASATQAGMRAVLQLGTMAQQNMPGDMDYGIMYCDSSSPVTSPDFWFDPSKGQHIFDQHSSVDASLVVGDHSLMGRSLVIYTGDSTPGYALEIRTFEDDVIGWIDSEGFTMTGGQLYVYSVIAVWSIQSNGTLIRKAGTSNSYVSPGGALTNYIVDANNSGTGETDLYSYVTPANVLNTNSHALRAIYAGRTAANGNNKTFKAYFAGIQILTSGATTLNNKHWEIELLIMRTSTNTARALAKFTSDGVTPIITQTDLASLNFFGTNIIKITGQSGTASNDITAKFGKVEFVPA